MSALLIHYLFFTLAVAAGCGALSGAARLMARGMRLETAETSGRSLIAGMLAVGLAGMAGQFLFARLHEGLGWGFPAARLVGWVAAGTLVGLATSLVTPYMPRLRSAGVGVLAGLAGWLAFGLLMAPGGEAPARIGGVLALWTVLPLAALFPLPDSKAVCAHCVCERSEEPVPQDSTPSVPAVVPVRRDSVAALLGEAEHPPLPGRLPLLGRVPIPGSYVRRD